VAASDRHGVGPMSQTGVAGELGWKLLLEGAVRHSCRFENQVFHGSCEWTSRRFLDKELHDDEGATRVTHDSARLRDDPYRFRIGGGTALEYVLGRWEPLPGLMARNAGDAQPCVMAQDSTQRDGLFGGVPGKVPGSEPLPDVSIEVEQAFVDET
jgi:hypothetical protein